jgi:hypothetical protein
VEFESDSEGGEIQIGDDEILEARWFSEPPDRVTSTLSEKIATWRKQ